MTARRTPFARHRPAVLAGLAGVGLIVAACTSAGAGSSPSPSTAVASTTPSPSAAPGASATAKPSPSPKISQTDTGWGRIWDAVPPSFPIPAGASPVSPDIPASAEWSIASGDAAAITQELKVALEKAGYSSSVDGPLEDGSQIIDSVGKPDACHVQTRVRPLGTTVVVTVLFAAACPFR